LSLTLSVCMYLRLFVTELLQIDSSFSFLDGIGPFFGHQFSVWHSTKRCYSIFDLGPLTPKIYSPKFALWVTESVVVCGSWYVGQNEILARRGPRGVQTPTGLLFVFVSCKQRNYDNVFSDHEGIYCSDSCRKKQQKNA